MVDPYLPESPDKAAARDFGFAGGKDNMFPIPRLIETGPNNLLRNGLFWSWSQGTTTTPDAWEDNGVGTFSRSTTKYWGTYGLNITKVSTDGAASRIWQSLENYVSAASCPGQPFTFSIMAKTDQGTGCIRPYVYDGAYKYGPWYTGDDAWQRISVTYVPPTYSGTPTDLDVGIEVDETSSTTDVEYYFDMATCDWGLVPYYYVEHPNDRSVICQDWDDDETYTIVRGAMRCIPYETSYEFTGGSPTESNTITLQYGCKQIIHATVNVYSITGYSVYQLGFHTNNYTTTSFDIEAYMTSGANIGASRSYVANGVVWAIGWDDEEEQWL